MQSNVSGKRIVFELDYARWKALCERLGIIRADEKYQDLSDAYTQKHRHYHTAQHIGDCLRYLDESENPLARDPLVEYALWYHDAYYSVLPFMSKRNEHKSAERAVRDMGDHSMSQDRGKVRLMILATRHDGSFAGNNRADLVADVDLAGLAKPYDEYLEDGKRVMAEWWWLPRSIFLKHRLKFLAHLLTRGWIYRTEEFSRKYEAQARGNLQKETEVWT
jgi:predicted metal-dependent HD superfamily phosphohydrolase